MTWEMNSQRSLIRGERFHDHQRYEEEMRRVSTPAHILKRQMFKNPFKKKNHSTSPVTSVKVENKHQLT